MTTLLRGVLIASAAALAAGLVLHLAGVALGDRVITGGLVALVAIPVANTIAAVVNEVRRNDQ
jgi:hypothetical protein